MFKDMKPLSEAVDKSILVAKTSETNAELKATFFKAMAIKAELDKARSKKEENSEKDLSIKEEDGGGNDLSEMEDFGALGKSISP